MSSSVAQSPRGDAPEADLFYAPRHRRVVSTRPKRFALLVARLLFSRLLTDRQTRASNPKPVRPQPIKATTAGLGPVAVGTLAAQLSLSLSCVAGEPQAGGGPIIGSAVDSAAQRWGSHLHASSSVHPFLARGFSQLDEQEQSRAPIPSPIRTSFQHSIRPSMQVCNAGLSRQCNSSPPARRSIR